MPLSLLSLTISAFAIGTTEFVIVGLIPEIANSLNVSLPSAGLLVSLYAAGVAIGAPILTALSNKYERKHVLLSIMALFIIGNFSAWLAPNYETLILSRIITGLAHGVFFSIGATIATSLVSKDQEARAIAIMFTGLTVALVTGVPLGTWIGQVAEWRTTFLTVTIMGAIAFLSILFLIPRSLPKPEITPFKQQFTPLLEPKLLLIFSITALGYGGTFVTFTYISPILSEISGFTKTEIAGLLLIYGASVSVGNILGGRLADKIGPLPALLRLFSGLTFILFILYFTASSPILIIITLCFWGGFAFGNVPPLQVYIVQQAKIYTPQAVNVASGLNIAAFNVGIALGAIIGGLVVENLPLLYTAPIGGLIVCCAFLLTWLSHQIDQKRDTHAQISA